MPEFICRDITVDCLCVLMRAVGDCLLQLKFYLSRDLGRLAIPPGSVPDRCSIDVTSTGGLIVL